MDTYIRGGLIVDGTGKTAYPADIGIQGDRIVWINRHPENGGLVDCPTIDATGLIISPGFIDAHTHSDFVFFQEPRPDMKLRQGVTTEISGNCGSSAAPISPQNLAYLGPYVQETIEAVGSFHTFGEYRDRIQEHGLINNQGLLIGHAALRTSVMGMKNQRASPDQISSMKRLLEQALDEGAIGFSSGLFYPPMVYSDTQELIELCRVVAQRGKIFACHMRNYSTNVLQAVEEMITVARGSGVRLQISHLMTAGRKNWGKSEQVLQMIDHECLLSLDITFDQYPYHAALPGLLALLPPWMHEGGVDRTVERLQDLMSCDQAKKDIEQGLPGWENVTEQAGWENLVVISPKIGEYSNQTIASIADATRADPADVVFSLLLTDPYCNLVAHWLNEEDVIEFMRHPAQMWGSDSAESGPLAHPRTYGTYPKILREYVFEKGVLSLETAIQKMSSMEANRFGINQRGVIKEGFFADLVLFNPETIKPTSTYDAPDVYPEGVIHVFVNGKIAVENMQTASGKFGNVL